MCEGRGLEISNILIYTKPKAAFLICGYGQNFRSRLRNVAPSQTKAAF